MWSGPRRLAEDDPAPHRPAGDHADRIGPGRTAPDCAGLRRAGRARPVQGDCEPRPWHRPACRRCWRREFVLDALARAQVAFSWVGRFRGHSVASTPRGSPTGRRTRCGPSLRASPQPMSRRKARPRTSAPQASQRPRREGDARPEREGDARPEREGDARPEREGDARPEREGDARRQGEGDPSREGGRRSEALSAKADAETKREGGRGDEARTRTRRRSAKAEREDAARPGDEAGRRS
jgi:hypothetical protein